MGEGEESLEDLVDLFPEVQDEPECGAAHHRHRHETDGFHPPAPNHETSATFQHEEILPSPPHALPRTGSLDFHQILGTDQDAEMMGILTHNNSSWSTQPNAHESSGLARRAPWEDFPLSHDNSISHDEDDALHSHNARGEGRFDRNTGGGYGKGKENAQDDHDPKRRGTRKRKATSRFDPVEAEVEPMRYADNGRTADGVRSASKRPTRVKMEEEREEPAEVKIEEESEQESEEEEKQQKKAKKKKTSIVHARAVPVGLRASRSPSASSSSRSPSASSSSRKGAASRKVGRPPHQEKCAASSQQTRATIQQEGMQRGRHVGHKPQMQKTARAGQKRWKQVLAKMRAEAARIPASKTFTIQMTQVREHAHAC